jgi:hypothetical protein
MSQGELPLGLSQQQDRFMRQRLAPPTKCGLVTGEKLLAEKGFNFVLVSFHTFHGSPENLPEVWLPLFFCAEAAHQQGSQVLN